MYKINLLPPELQRDVSIDFKTLAIRASAVVAAVGLVAMYCAFLYNIHSIKLEISQEEKYLSEIQFTVKKVEEIKNKRLANEQSVQKYRELLDNRVTWSPVLEDLNKILPTDMWLESINISHVDRQVQGGGAIIPAPQPPPVQLPGYQLQSQIQAKTAGTAQGGQGENQPVSSLPTPNTLTINGYSRTAPSVGVYLHNLGKMPYYSKVALNEMGEDEKESAYKFKITATVKEGDR